LVATISNGAKTKALIAAAVGLLLATVGRDIFTGESRFTFGNLELADGIDFVPIAMGIFGLGEILYNLEERHRRQGAVQGHERLAITDRSHAGLRRDRPRFCPRVLPRHFARWRCHHRIDGLLCDGEEARQAAGTVR
jgi:hypothetical protein